MHCMYVTPFLPQRAAYVMNHSTYEAQILQRACPDIGAALAKNRTLIHIDMTHNSIDDNGLKMIAESL